MLHFLMRDSCKNLYKYVFHCVFVVFQYIVVIGGWYDRLNLKLFTRGNRNVKYKEIIAILFERTHHIR